MRARKLHSAGDNRPTADSASFLLPTATAKRRGGPHRSALVLFVVRGILLCFGAILLIYYSTESRDVKSKQAACSEDPRGNKKALDLIEVASPPSLLSLKRRPRVLCFVNTYDANHATKRKAVHDTWGQRCDKLLLISNVADPSIAAVKLPLKGGYSHDNLWEKVRSAFRYVWEHYPDYDFYYKADDDTYMIYENMVQYLASDQIQYRIKFENVMLGHRFHLPDKYVEGNDSEPWRRFRENYGHLIYDSGGSGYVVNRNFVKTFVESVLNDTSICPVERNTFEDGLIVLCTMHTGLEVVNTRDHFNRQRFHWMNPAYTFDAQPCKPDDDSWWCNYHKGVGGIQSGRDSISTESIAFHYVKPEEMYAIDQQLYDCRLSLRPSRNVEVMATGLLVVFFLFALPVGNGSETKQT